mmetsp:Transcript_47449/g.148409  ORF Transcript_47449/g.148409 Transcript_47449/m.148409 type:complete len:207 (+) Transcript_47449:232-852(+)
MRCGALSLRGMLPPSRGCRRRRSAAGGRTSCCFAASQLLSRWRWAPSPSHSSAGSRTSSSRASRSTLSTSRSQHSSLEALACPGSSMDCTGQLAAPSTFGRRGCCCCWRGRPPQGARAFSRGRCGCAALPPPATIVRVEGVGGSSLAAFSGPVRRGGAPARRCDAAVRDAGLCARSGLAMGGRDASAASRAVSDQEMPQPLSTPCR